MVAPIGAPLATLVTVTTQVSLGELIRLAFPAGTPAPKPPVRDLIVKWVTMAGAGLAPTAGDFVLCGAAPSRRDLPPGPSWVWLAWPCRLAPLRPPRLICQ